MTSSYGGFYGGDPRKFHPDHECCTADEIAAHAAACREWDQGNRPPDPPGHESTHDPVTGKLIQHIARNPFGIGVTVFDDEPEEEYPDEEERGLDELDEKELSSVYLSAWRLARRHHDVLGEYPEMGDDET